MVPMEEEIVSFIKRSVESDERLAVGIGDDAAVLRTGRDDTVVTTDMLTDGVDFIVGQVDPFLIGRKSLAVNLSDLAAMGALPHSAFVAIALPESGTTALAKGIQEGIMSLAKEYNILIAGGDTNVWSGGLVISVTAIGTVSPGKVFRRSGARPGDWLLTTGALGGSILGRQFTFTPRVSEANILLSACRGIHAAMDISDGLLLDLTRLAKESNVGFLLTDSTVPIHSDARSLSRLIHTAFEVKRNDPALFTTAARRTSEVRFPLSAVESLSPEEATAAALLLYPKIGHTEESEFSNSPLDHALFDGEDFELLLAVPPEIGRKLLADRRFMAIAGITFTKLGEFRDASFGYQRELESGETITVSNPGGFVHGGSNC